ncbi:MULTISPECIES: plasmid recombination protein [unclassified Alteromonas]|mgnify:CR=1 FL=1|uniref:plasmid recombination protein n=1 Tax=unclassified Alteromonas TaxID=2614992 RepID=UPI001EF243BA|nr:plasmid recombination protein [Alteromonas sp. CNT1-28]MCG7811335.1 plasmid recombination protein [Alteromonas sp. MCA-1]
MNNSYQFIHLETYADKPRKGSGRPAAEAVARECQRVEQSYPHIQNPLAAQLIYGVEPIIALNEDRSTVKRCRDAMGRKIRSDAQFVSFGVASTKVESTPENWNSAEVQHWVNDTLEFLEKRFGSSFVSAVAHLDERWVHIHFVLAPKSDISNQLDISSIHPGLAAQRLVKESSKSKKDFAYKEAMRCFQDEYYESVGLKNGQLRYGPRRRRLSRKEWHAQVRVAQLLKKIFLDKNEQIYKLSIGLKKAKSLLSDVIYKTIKNNNKVKVNRNEFIPK